MSKFITLKTRWTTPWGFQFPVGTVFFERTRKRDGTTVYEYEAPDGAHSGQICLDPGKFPGI
jgi:hypothetical protein